jgi:hypothetical protein
MRRDLQKPVSTYFDTDAPIIKAPPIILPPEKPKEQPQEKLNYPAPRSSEVVFVLKVVPEYRIKDRSRLVVELTHLNDHFKMPRIRLRPGMYIKLTVIAEPVNGDNNAKK